MSDNKEDKQKSEGSKPASRKPSERSALQRPRIDRIVARAIELSGKINVMALWIGLASGVFAAAYVLTLEAGMHLLWETSLAKIPFYVITTVAGLVVGLLLQWLGSPGEIDMIVDNIHMRGGRIDTRRSLAMIPISLVSIASGGSAGPEAPLVQIAGSIGTWFSDQFVKKPTLTRTLTISGMAAGITALFGAPLGGALFALEILHSRSFIEYYEAFVPATLASCAGFGVYALLLGRGLAPIWEVPHYTPLHSAELLIALLIGVLGAGVALLFAGIFKTIKKAFHDTSLPIWAKATLGGLGIGIVGYYFPLTRFFSEEQMNGLIFLKASIPILLAIAFCKMLTISFTLGSGWRGGFIIPCFFIGACLGKIVAMLIPGAPVGLCIVAGMTGVCSSVTKTPISFAVMLPKLTGIDAAAPILFAGLTSFFLTGWISVIESQRSRPRETQPLSARGAKRESGGLKEAFSEESSLNIDPAV
jgi:H+/Cl- antiporter ClcA